MKYYLCKSLYKIVLKIKDIYSNDSIICNSVIQVDTVHKRKLIINSFYEVTPMYDYWNLNIFGSVNNIISLKLLF